MIRIFSQAMPRLYLLLLLLSFTWIFSAAAEEWDWEVEDTPRFIHGFIEAAYGQRTVTTKLQSDTTLADLRARIEADYESNALQFTLKSDLLYDALLHETVFSLRELSVKADIGNRYNLKIGRQILTWGTGDYLFLNDLFAKDWQSFLAGRDDENLKAPSNAIKFSIFFKAININLVWMPEFQADTYLNGERFSFYNPRIQNIDTTHLEVISPKGDEWAIRAYRTIKGSEFAFYGYEGFNHQPLVEMSDGQLSHNRLSVFGASMRRPLLGGLFNVEFARHINRQDTSRRFTTRWLVAYEREIASRLNLGMQLYLEEVYGEANRMVITQRLTYRSLNDKLNLSNFIFYSNSNQDLFIRPSLSYRFDDTWRFTTGMNIFIGDKITDQYGQFKQNNNIWLRLRVSF